MDKLPKQSRHLEAGLLPLIQNSRYIQTLRELIQTLNRLTTYRRDFVPIRIRQDVPDATPTRKQ